MKKIVALLMASAMAASLAACGGNAQSSEAASTAPAESTAAESTSTNGKKYEGVELTMWSMWSAGEVQANAIQAAADAFEAETGAHVNIEWNLAKNWTSSRMITTVSATLTLPTPTT